MHYLILGYLFYVFMNGVVSDDVRDKTTYICRSQSGGIVDDAVICYSGGIAGWCCEKNNICGTQYGTCTSRYSSGGNLSFGAIAGIVLGTIALILLITGLNYCAGQRQQVQRLSQVRSVYNPFLYTTPPTSFSRSTYKGPLPPSTTLATISATVTDSPA